jgi:hypothetical protein
MRSVMAMLVTLSLGVTVPGGADDPPPRDEAATAAFTDGTRVRLKLNETRKSLELPGKLEGRILSADEESFTVRLRDGREIIVPVRAIERLQVPVGRHPRWWGALNGMGIGGLVWAVLSGVALATCDENANPEWGCFGWVVVLICGTPVAAGVGGAVGALLPPGERWETRRLQVAVRPVVVRGGVGVRLTVSF